MLETKVSDKLLDKLKAKQGDLSDYRFVKTLKPRVSQQLWQMTRTGKTKLGYTILKGSSAYPDLALDVLEYLGFDVKEVISFVTNHTDASETSPERNSGVFIKRLGRIFKR